MASNCTSVVLDLGGGALLDSPCVDRDVLAFAVALGHRSLDMYVPAQHGTGWDGPLSRLQAEAHGLAVLGL